MAPPKVTFGILGALEVRVEGHEVALPGRVVRQMLAALLLSANQRVEGDLLAARTWGSQVAGRGAMHTAAYRLRSWLTDEVALPDALVHDSGGYRLRTPPDSLDSDRFRSLVRTAADQAEDIHRVGNLEEALGLWRGPVLADLPNWTRDHPEVAVLERERVAAHGALADAAVAGGRRPPEPTVRALEQLASDLPYDEAVQARWLMLLGASGQRAEALRHYETIRARLADDLGVDPSAMLRDTYLALLAEEPHAVAPTGAIGRPEMMPREVVDFTGRSVEVRRLLQLAEPGAWAQRVIAIDGMAGAGKTTIAVHAAYRLAESYPDGALFVDLHGHTEGQDSVEPASALGTLLRAIGVPREQIPDEPEQRAALWRSELTTRRLIVVLDNAAGASQVRPLLPGPTPSVVLITSRRRLTGLDDAKVISLDPLGPDDAAELFTSIVGQRAVDQPAAVHDVATTCGRLPLAVRIAAVRLLHRPTWSVIDLAARLGDEHRRLGELTAEDRSVGAAFSLSYRGLTAERQRAFRLLGLVPGQDLDAQAAAALLQMSTGAAARMLDDLVDTHLLQEPAPGRFQFHDLVRQYAASTAADDEPPDERANAVRRLLDYYVHAAEGAAVFLEPIGLRVDPDDIPPPAEWTAPSDSAGAAAWLTTEYCNVIASAHRAGAEDLSMHAWHLVQAVTALCRHRGQFSEGVELHEFALTMARPQDDNLREGITYQNLAGTYWAHGRTKEALAHCQSSISLYRAIGDRDREMRATGNLGTLYDRLGDYPAALRCLRAALTRDEETGDVRGQAIELSNIGSLLEKLGDHELALQHQRQALEILRQVDDSWVEADIHCGIGSSLRHLGRYEEAKPEYEAALSLLKPTADPTSEGVYLGEFGVVLAHLGQSAEALRLCDQGLALLREADAKAWLATLLNDVGRLHEDTTDITEAKALFQEALDAARYVADPYEEARALEGLGSVAAHGEDLREALHMWQLAQQTFRRVAVPDADRVAKRIADASR